MKTKFKTITILVIMALFFSACEKEDDNTTNNNNNGDTNDGSLVAVITTDFETGDAPLKINFDASSSTDSDGTISNYKWSFGEDDNSATTKICSYTYNSTGSFTVTLTVTDNDGNTDNATKTITVTEPAYLSLFPLNAIGSQWAYHVKSYKKTASPTTIEGDILVTLINFDRETKYAAFKVTGEQGIYYSSQPSAFQLKEENGVLKYKSYTVQTGSSTDWTTSFQPNGTWDSFVCFLGRTAHTGVGEIENISGNSYTCGTGDDNWDDNYSMNHYEYYWRHTINPQTGFVHSKWYDYENDGDPATPGPYVYSNEVTRTAYSILQDDGTVLENGSGTAVQFLISEYSPGTMSGEEPIYDRRHPVNISFNIDVNKSTVENDFSVLKGQTPLSGSFVWNDNKSFIWTPSNDYPDGYIEVKLTTNSQSASGLPLYWDGWFQFYFIMDANS